MRYGAGVAELAYARVSSEKQSLERQIHALTAAGIERERIYVDKKSGATTDRPGLRKLFEYARKGDRITVHTLDPRSVAEQLATRTPGGQETPPARGREHDPIRHRDRSR